MKFLFIIFLFLIKNQTVFSQQLYEKQLYPFDGLDGDFFGRQIAVSDSFLFVSSLRYENGVDAAVYFYKFNNNDYRFINKIYPNDPEPTALFSTEILYENKQLFVGAQNKKVNGLTVGALYVFEYENNNWVEKQKIVPPEPRTFRGLFSNEIAKYENFLLVSAFRADTVVNDVGKVFLYEFFNNQYELVREFAPQDAKEYQYFGASLLMNDSLIIIGSQNDSTISGEGSGSIYVYEKTNSVWNFREKYIPEPNSNNLAFGCDLGTNDEYVFVGTSNNIYYDKPGQVYIYKYNKSKLELVQIIKSGDNYSNDGFGNTLSVQADSLLVGARTDTVKNDFPGAAYLFANESGMWNLKKKIVPSNETKALEFGAECVLKNDKIFIGAHETKFGNNFTGAVYIYTNEPLTQIKKNSLMPNEFYVSHNYPNPFNPTTKISYQIKESGLVQLKIYNTLVKEVAVLVNETKAQGSYVATFDASGLASGVYFYSIRAGEFFEIKKMVLMK